MSPPRRLTLVPDTDRVLANWLRAQPEVVRLVGDRVYTTFPRKAGGECLILVRRTGGTPPVPRPLVYDQALTQVDVYGGGRGEAYEVVAVVRAVCSERAGGTPSGTPAIVVGALRYVPDEIYDPPRPRYVCDLEVYVRPAAVTARPAREEKVA